MQNLFRNEEYEHPSALSAAISVETPEFLFDFTLELIRPFDNMIEVLFRCLNVGKGLPDLTFLCCLVSVFYNKFGANELTKICYKLLGENFGHINLWISFSISRKISVLTGNVNFYSKWFRESFSNLSDKNLISLMKFLTFILPFERADIIRIHLCQNLKPNSSEPQDLIKDYIAVAKTRISDLESFISPEQEIDEAAMYFGRTGKIPQKLIQISMFRKNHWNNSIVPKLRSASKRKPEVLNLVQELVKKSKLSPSCLNE